MLLHDRGDVGWHDELPINDTVVAAVIILAHKSTLGPDAAGMTVADWARYASVVTATKVVVVARSPVKWEVSLEALLVAVPLAISAQGGSIVSLIQDACPAAWRRCWGSSISTLFSEADIARSDVACLCPAGARH
jgi:hypothetical protein